MKPTVHKQSLDAAVAEASQLIKERDELDAQLERVNEKIGDLTQAIEGLSPLCGIDAKETYSYLFPEAIEPEIGFTDAVRKVLNKTPYHMMSAVAVRDELTASGFDLDKYTNPMASIHTILKRLVKSETVFSHDEEGRVYYCWNPAQLYRRKLRRAAKKTTSGK